MNLEACSFSSSLWTTAPHDLLMKFVNGDEGQRCSCFRLTPLHHRTAPWFNAPWPWSASVAVLTTGRAAAIINPSGLLRPV